MQKAPSRRWRENEYDGRCRDLGGTSDGWMACAAGGQQTTGAVTDTVYWEMARIERRDRLWSSQCGALAIVVVNVLFGQSAPRAFRASAAL